VKNFNLAILIALLVVLTSVTIRRSVGGFGTDQSSLAPLGMIAIGTSPAPLPPSPKIGTSPAPLPPSPKYQIGTSPAPLPPSPKIGTSPAPLPPSPKHGAGFVPFAPIS